jgi:hypothetical protein
MRKFVLIAALLLASASAQAGESRSLSSYPDNDTTSTVPSPPVADQSLRADNDTPAAQPVETPRYSPPPGEATSNPPSSPPAAETPHYTARPAAVGNTRATTATTTAQAPSSDYSSRGNYLPREVHGRMMRAQHPHHQRLTAGRIIAALHRYGIYW